MELRFIQPGKRIQNTFIEQFNKSFEHEVLDANLFNKLSEVQNLAGEWFTDYNDYRLHDFVRNLLPAVVKPRIFKSEISTLEL